MAVAFPSEETARRLLPRLSQLVDMWGSDAPAVRVSSLRDSCDCCARFSALSAFSQALATSNSRPLTPIALPCPGDFQSFALHAFGNICACAKAIASKAAIAAAADWHIELMRVFQDAGSPFDPKEVVLLDGACKALSALCKHGPHIEYFSKSPTVVNVLFQLLTSRRLKSRKLASWALAALMPLSASGVILVGAAAGKTAERVYKQGGAKKGRAF